MGDKESFKQFCTSKEASFSLLARSEDSKFAFVLDNSSSGRVMLKVPLLRESARLSPRYRRWVVENTNGLKLNADREIDTKKNVVLVSSEALTVSPRSGGGNIYIAVTRKSGSFYEVAVFTVGKPITDVGLVHFDNSAEETLEGAGGVFGFSEEASGKMPRQAVAEILKFGEGLGGNLSISGIGCMFNNSTREFSFSGFTKDKGLPEQEIASLGTVTSWVSRLNDKFGCELTFSSRTGTLSSKVPFQAYFGKRGGVSNSEEFFVSSGASTVSKVFLPDFSEVAEGSKITLTIPEGVSVIDSGALCFFKGKVSSLVLPDSLEELHDYALFGLGLEQIEFGSSLKVIGERALMCNCLKSISLSPSLVSVGAQAFSRNPQLHYVSIFDRGLKVATKEMIEASNFTGDVLRAACVTDKYSVNAKVNHYLKAYPLTRYDKLNGYERVQDIVCLGNIASNSLLTATKQFWMTKDEFIASGKKLRERYRQERAQAKKKDARSGLDRSCLRELADLSKSDRANSYFVVAKCNDGVIVTDFCANTPLAYADTPLAYYKLPKKVSESTIPSSHLVWYVRNTDNLCISDGEVSIKDSVEGYPTYDNGRVKSDREVSIIVHRRLESGALAIILFNDRALSEAVQVSIAVDTDTGESDVKHGHAYVVAFDKSVRLSYTLTPLSEFIRERAEVLGIDPAYITVSCVGWDYSFRYNCFTLKDVESKDLHSNCKKHVKDFKSEKDFSEVNQWVDEINSRFKIDLRFNSDLGMLFCLKEALRNRVSEKDDMFALQYKERCRYIESPKISVGGEKVDISIPEGVRTISLGAFHAFGNKIRKLTLPESLTKIGDYAFFGCGIEEVVFGSSVYYIGRSAFQYNCLGNVIFPPSLVHVGTQAVANNDRLARVGVYPTAFVNRTKEIITKANETVRYFDEVELRGRKPESMSTLSWSLKDFIDGGVASNFSVSDKDVEVSLLVPIVEGAAFEIKAVNDIASYEILALALHRPDYFIRSFMALGCRTAVSRATEEYRDEQERKEKLTSSISRRTRSFAVTDDEVLSILRRKEARENRVSEEEESLESSVEAVTGSDMRVESAVVAEEVKKSVTEEDSKRESLIKREMAKIWSFLKGSKREEN